MYPVEKFVMGTVPTSNIQTRLDVRKKSPQIFKLMRTVSQYNYKQSTNFFASVQEGCIFEKTTKTNRYFGGNKKRSDAFLSACLNDVWLTKSSPCFCTTRN